MDKLMRVPVMGGTPQPVLTAHLEGRPHCARLPAPLCAMAERSADRKQLVFTAFDSVKGRGRKLAEFDTDAAVDYWWDLSPDGTRIAIVKNRAGQVHILSPEWPGTSGHYGQGMGNIDNRRLGRGWEESFRIQLQGPGAGHPDRLPSRQRSTPVGTPGWHRHLRGAFPRRPPFGHARVERRR
jgi:hypothetical protein